MVRKHLITGAAALALSLAIASGTTSVSSSALAAAQDYRFELAGTPQPARGGKSVVPVRLVHVPDGKPVTDAVVFEAKADMGPAGMPTMTAPAKALKPGKDGLYRVEVEPGMAGAWAITLAAKVQGETETVRGSITAELVK
jgi:YtkA-like